MHLAAGLLSRDSEIELEERKKGTNPAGNETVVCHYCQTWLLVPRPFRHLIRYRHSLSPLWPLSPVESRGSATAATGRSYFVIIQAEFLWRNESCAGALHLITEYEERFS